MPKPQDITLRNLTVKPVKGTQSPLISTVLAQRDGTRGGVLPPPSSDDDLRFDGPYKPKISIDKLGGGTVDPTFTFDRFSYKGSFKIPKIDEFSLEMSTICHSVPSGRTGPYGSLFVGYDHNDNANIQEWDIPEPSLTDDFNALPEATRLQDKFYWTQLSGLINPRFNKHCGWLRFIDNKLVLGNYKTYEAGTVQDENVLIINTPFDLENTTWRGLISLEGKSRVSKQCNSIPVSLRAQFNNDTHFAGVYAGMSIIGRSSQGQSFYTFTPGDLNTATYINSTQWANFWPEFQHKTTSYNFPLSQYFEDTHLEMPISAWVRVPATATTPQSENKAVVTNESVTLSFDFNKSSNSDGPSLTNGKEMVLSNYGVVPNSIVVRNSARTTTYTLGVDYNLFVNTKDGRQFGQPNWNDAYGMQVISKIDTGSISNNEELSVDYQYLLQRYPDFSYFPRGIDDNTLDDAGSYNVFTTCAFFVPGTKTLMVIGQNAMRRYGGAYKHIRIENANNGIISVQPGNGAIDGRDYDSYFWLLNADDLSGAVNPYDPKFYRYGVWDNNRFIEHKATNGGHSNAGDFDPASKRLYVGSKTSTGALISVYEIT